MANATTLLNGTICQVSTFNSVYFKFVYNPNFVTILYYTIYLRNPLSIELLTTSGSGNTSLNILHF